MSKVITPQNAIKMELAEESCVKSCVFCWCLGCDFMLQCVVLRRMLYARASAGLVGKEHEAVARVGIRCVVCCCGCCGVCCGVLLCLVVLFCLVFFGLCWLVWGADGNQKR